MTDFLKSAWNGKWRWPLLFGATDLTGAKLPVVFPTLLCIISAKANTVGEERQIISWCCYKKCLNIIDPERVSRSTVIYRLCVRITDFCCTETDFTDLVERVLVRWQIALLSKCWRPVIFQDSNGWNPFTGLTLLTKCLCYLLAMTLLFGGERT